MQQTETFYKWLERHAEPSGVILEEVAERAGISRRRMRHLIDVGGPSSEEAEDIATEAFGLFRDQAYTSPMYEVATRFRSFLASQGREEYRFPRLWPQVRDGLVYRTDNSSHIMTDELFLEVLEADRDDGSW